MRYECDTASVMSALVRSMARECAEIVIMSAHVTKRKTQDKQDETTKNYLLKLHKNSVTQTRVNTQPRLTATLSPTRELKAQVTHWHPRDLIAV